MRILHFLPSLDARVGGPARAVQDLCRALASRGHDVTLCTSDPGDSPSDWRTGGHGRPHVVVLEKPRFPGATFLERELRPLRTLMTRQDVVHLHGVWEYGNVQVAAIATANGVPYIVSPRGMLAEWSLQQRRLKKRLYLALAGTRWLKQATRVHFTAELERLNAPASLAQDRAVTIPNLLDLNGFAELPSLTEARLQWLTPEPSRPRVLFISRIHPKKGLDVLIQACASLKRSGATFELLIAGDGDRSYVQSMRALAASSGLGTQDVRFLGTVTGSRKLALYRACDVMALPTHQENFGFVYVEALACQLPVVTTAVDLHHELRESGAATIVSRSPEHFSEAISSWIQMPHEMRASKGARAREWVFSKFNVSSVVSAFETMYREAASQQRQSETLLESHS